MNDADRSGIGSRKQAVSIRLSRNDVRHIKGLAERLGARDSDVIRFAIKLMLSKLSPLQDHGVRGRGLVPVFLECGPELMRHFELDAVKLSTIINDAVEHDQRVDHEDIQLIAMSGVQRSYTKLRVAGYRRTNGGSEAAPAAAKGWSKLQPEGDLLDDSLHQYLYEKYLAPEAPATVQHGTRSARAGGE
jgi:Arc/MetJ-type ribon-helix-helix transcriptional regulator